MNEKFFSLPTEKQQAILNAGYRVFSQSTYKKSPVSEIAEAAGISKSLLFHYFVNKRELYLFLWETCAKITLESFGQYGCYESNDLFERLRRGVLAKISVMKRYPDLGAFVLKAYYELDPDIRPAIQASCEEYTKLKTNHTLPRLDPAQFKEGLDLAQMYRQMYLAGEGYVWEIQQQGSIDLEKVERDFNEMIAFWKQIYLREEPVNESH